MLVGKLVYTRQVLKLDINYRKYDRPIHPYKMWLRMRYGTSADIGVYSQLTNSYCLLANNGPESFYCLFDKYLTDVVPIVRTSIANCDVIGCLTVGNRHGLLVPDSITELELQRLRNHLPESLKIRAIEDRLSALGNVIACNDHVALVHPELDRESVDIIADVLQVEVFRRTVADNPLVGSCTVLTNNGGLVHAKTGVQELEELTALVQVPLVASTVNNGKQLIRSGLSVNDYIAYVGGLTKYEEMKTIENVLKLNVTKSLTFIKEARIAACKKRDMEDMTAEVGAK